MSTARIPGLKVSTRRKVFREVVRQVKADPAMRFVKTWRAWTGLPTDAVEWSSGMVPGIRFTPGGSGAEYVTPDSYESILNIQVELALPDFNLDNHEDAYATLISSLCPDATGAKLALEQLRRDEGSHSGLVEFGPLTYPFKPDAASGFLLAVGSIRIDVYMTIH